MGATVPVAFARVLRGLGVDVPVASVLLYADALHATGLDRRDRVYWAGRATLVHRPEDVAAYDAAFAAFFLGAQPTIDPAPARATAATTTTAADDGGRAASPHEVLRTKDFAAYTTDEFAEARRLMAAFRLTGPTRRSRRLAPTRTDHGTLDVRATVRHALKTHGDPARPARRAPTTTPRRLVFLLDVSGSMEPYARALIRFVHAAVAARPHGKVDAFALGTRITRITRDLADRDPDAAIAKAAARVEDWAGGTRLADGIKAFNDQHTGRGAHVVILSDGWERGDPAHLAAQVERLGRTANRITWVNPHKASPGYEPIARGMAAALPYVDDFVDGHNLASLDALARRLSPSR